MLAAATCFTKLTTGLALTDTHNGLRAMTRRGASHNEEGISFSYGLAHRVRNLAAKVSADIHLPVR